MEREAKITKAEGVEAPVRAARASSASGSGCSTDNCPAEAAQQDRINKL